MKKLLLALGASACAIGAFAATLNETVGSNFEDTPFSEGATFDPTKDDNGGDPTLDTSAGLFWYTEDESGIEATWKKTPTTFLDIESTTKPLYRTIDDAVDGVEAKDIGTGIYIDTKVQFTAGDPTMPSDDPNAKLAIWLCGNNAEGEPLEDEDPYFMVRAASYASGSLVATNYKMAYSGNDIDEIKNGGFCQLTVKSIADIDTAQDEQRVGFVVFVNGTALTVVNTQAEPQTVFATSEGLTPVAKKWNNMNALLPSLQAVEADDDRQISMVGFYGKGAVDEVFFKSEAPTFAADDKTVTFNLGSGVDSVTYKIGDDETVYNYDGPFTVLYGATVTITDVDYKAGARPLDFDNEVEVTDDMTIDILTANWVVGETGYATLKEALTALNSVEGEKILVLADNVNEKLEVGSDMTLDLAGHKITAPDADNPPVFVGACKLTIKDSSESKSGEIVAVGTPAIWAESEDESVQATVEIEQAIVTGGVVAQSLSIKRGKFTPGEAGEQGFYLAEFIATGFVVGDKMVDGYWVVTEKPAATPIIDADVSLSATSATYTGGEIAKPTVTVTVDEQPLTVGTDYDVAYSEGWVNAGEYTIKVTGKVNYQGTVTKTFTINKASIEGMTVGLSSYEATEGSITLPEVSVDGLKLGTDFTVDMGGLTADSKAGPYTITVTGQGNYTGTATATFTVNAPAPIVKPEVAPGKEVEVNATSPEDAIGKVTPNIVVPGVAEGQVAINGDNYKALFEPVATEISDGTYAVTMQLKPEVEAVIKTDADAAVTKVNLTEAAAVTDANEELSEIEATDLTPGIFYSVEVADNLGFTGGKEGDRVMADGAGNANIPMPNPKALQNANGNARFFRVKANVKGN